MEKETVKPKSSTGYNKEYYDKNKETIQAKRKNRYDTDNAYREKIQKAARERKREKLAERRALGIKRKPRGPQQPSLYAIDVAGTEVEVLMFTAGQLGLKLGRKAQTIRLWEKRGILPEPLYRKPCGDRLYTEFQIEQLTIAFRKAKKKYGRLVNTRITSTNFPQLANGLWEDYPLGIDTSQV
jgi:hypothetical protein